MTIQFKTTKIQQENENRDNYIIVFIFQYNFHLIAYKKLITLLITRDHMFRFRKQEKIDIINSSNFIIALLKRFFFLVVAVFNWIVKNKLLYFV